MSATFTQARDYLGAIIKSASDAQGWPVDWEDVAKSDAGSFPPSDQTLTWIRPRIRHVAGGQRTLGGATGLKRFGRTGVIVVQVFTPRGTGLSRPDLNAKVLMDAFDKAVPDSTGVWLRNAAVNEIGPDGAYFQMNITAEFSYDEVK